MKRTLGLILIVFIGFVLIAGCTQEQTPKDELKIGVVASMTGPASTTGKDIWQSAQLAADEINAEGGVLGHPIKAIVEDGA